jgi:hypothetical protein
MRSFTGQQLAAERHSLTQHYRREVCDKKIGYLIKEIPQALPWTMGLQSASRRRPAGWLLLGHYAFEALPEPGATHTNTRTKVTTHA